MQTTQVRAEGLARARLEGQSLCELNADLDNLAGGATACWQASMLCSVHQQCTTATMRAI